MAKKILNGEEFGKLSDEWKKEYRTGDNGTYVLIVEGEEDLGALKRAKDHEKQRREAAEEKARKLQEEADEAARKAGDVGKIEERYKTEIADKEKAFKEEMKTLKAQLHGVMVGGVAVALAEELSTVPTIFAPVLEKRLTMEVKDGKPVTVVLDKDGKPSALDLDGLKKEILATTEYAGILKGSKGSGSGASGAKGGSGGKALSEMSEKERTEWYNRDPEGFKRAAEAARV